MSVYDQEKEKEQSALSNDGDNKTADDLRGLENSFSEPDAEYPDGHPSKDEANDASEKPSEEEQKISDKTGGSFGAKTDLYKPSSKVKSRFSDLSKATGKKKLFAIPLAVIGILIIIFFLMSLLKIPNYATNIAAYRMARTVMEYSRTSAAIDSQKVAVDTLDDRSYKTLITDKYGSMRSATWGKFDKYRPEIVYKNLGTTGTLDYVTETKKNSFGINRTKVKYVVLNGNYIETSNEKFGRFWSNYKERARFAGEIQANVDDALRGYKGLVRGSVASKIREAAGIKLKWWEKKGTEYRGKSRAEAARLQLEESYKNTHKVPAGTPLTAEIANAAKEATEEIQECIAEPKCADEINKTGTLPEKVSNNINEKLAGSFSKEALGVINSAYAIGVPLCLIFDGSTVNSGGDIDAQNASTQATFYGIESAADQQKSGDTTLEAVGALDNKIGEGNSVPDVYMQGKQPDTSGEKSPQANLLGEYTLANALLPSAVAENINTPAQTICPVVSSVQFAIGGAVVIGAVKIFLAVTTAGVGTAATQGGEEVVKKAFTTILKNSAEKAGKDIVVRVATKEGLKATGGSAWGFGKKFARDLAGIEAATVVSKLIVLSKMGVINDGATSTGTSFKNSADMGADVHSNELNRQLLYGAPMSNTDTATNDKLAADFAAKKDESLPIYDRYFALQNPRSLVSKFGYQLRGFKNEKKPLVTKTLSAINPINLVKTLGFGSKSAIADDGSLNTHYGIIQWGWTPQEDALRQTESYSMLENAIILENSNKAAEIEAKYGECFTASIGTLISTGKVVRSENGDIVKDKGLCSPLNLGPNNPEGFNNLVFRWRVDKSYNGVIDQNLGIQEPTADNSATPPTGPVNCASSVGNQKIVCAAQEAFGYPYAYFDHVRSNCVGYDGGDIGYPASAWVKLVGKSSDGKTIGDKNICIGCSGFANVALYRAFGIDLSFVSVDFYRNDKNFKIVPLKSVQPGDFLIANPGGQAGANNHVAIVESYDPASGKLVTVESSAGENDNGKALSGRYSSRNLTEDFKGASRYIGPGSGVAP